VVAAEEAAKSAGVTADDFRQIGRKAAAVIGSSKGSMLRFAELHEHLCHASKSVREKPIPSRDRKGADPSGVGRPLPYGRGSEYLGDFWSSVPPPTAVDIVARRFGIAGARHCPVAACATGTIAVVRAAQLIADGRAELVVCGAADASIHPLWIGAFDRMGVLARPHAIDGAAGACRPFDIDRTGFAIGEGAGMLILESAESLGRRGASPIARIRSWALGADPSDLIGLDASARPVISAIRAAMDRAEIRPDDIDLVTAHATATPTNDAVEAIAYRWLGHERSTPCPVTAVKGAIGHMLGAAGAAELALTVEMLRRQTILPTANYRRAGQDTAGTDIVRHAQSGGLGHILKVSLGFGGHIAAVILSHP
jgi:3-oxoacyl-[acyl-carrier-protein] synthase II